MASKRKAQVYIGATSASALEVEQCYEHFPCSGKSWYWKYPSFETSYCQLMDSENGGCNKHWLYHVRESELKDLPILLVPLC